MSRRIQECARCEKVDGIDRAAGVIRGVKLLGERSDNPPPDNHEYPRATRESAIPLLEGRRVFVDHPPRSSRGETRSYRDNMGLIRNVEERGDGAYGDWHFNPKHELAQQVFWDAEHNPQALGFSINGAGDKRRENGRVIVESITDLESIDLVSRPATTGGLFESRRTAMRKTVRELIEQLKKSRPGYARGLREEVASGILSDDAPMDEPPPMDEPDGDEDMGDDEGPDHEQALKDGFKAAIHHIVDDDSIEMQEKIRLISDRLKSMGKLCAKKTPGAPSPDIADDDADDGPPVEESRRKIQTKALLELGRKGVKLEPLTEMAIKGLRTDDDLKRLVESLSGGTRTPRSSLPGSGTSKRLEESAKQPAEDEDQARERRVKEMRSKR